MRDQDTAPRGFTLLELMIVVALIGVLAAVVIPNWTSTARNKKYDPEISAMMTELSTREEQYKSEVGNGAYLAITTACPSAPQPNGVDFNTTCVNPGGSLWATLRVQPSDPLIRCQYAITTGVGGTTPSGYAPCVAPTFANGSAASLAGAWYWIKATCDMKGDGGTNATFCMASWNTKVYQLNYGL